MIQSFMRFTIAVGLMTAGLALAFPAAALAQKECEASCPGGQPGDGRIVVKLESTGGCMCAGEKCFKVDIGSAGPEMTASGTTQNKIEGCQGGKYQSKPQPSAQYDNDCLKMGIPANDSVGKWIHKTQGCKPGGTNSTLGCIGVPCEHWVDLVELTKKQSTKVEVCGSKQGGSATVPSNFSGETQEGDGNSTGGRR